MNAGVLKMLICQNEMHNSQPRAYCSQQRCITAALRRRARGAASERRARRVRQIVAAAAAASASGLLSQLWALLKEKLCIGGSLPGTPVTLATFENRRCHVNAEGDGMLLSFWGMAPALPCIHSSRQLSGVLGPLLPCSKGRIPVKSACERRPLMRRRCRANSASQRDLKGFLKPRLIGGSLFFHKDNAGCTVCVVCVCVFCFFFCTVWLLFN